MKTQNKGQFVSNNTGQSTDVSINQTNVLRKCQLFKKTA